MIVNPSDSELFTYEGNIIIEEILVVGSSDYINHTISIPTDFVISSAYPNPFNPSTNIQLDLSFDANVSLKAFNLTGQLVEVISDRGMSKGSHVVNWNASNLSSGVYFIISEVNGSSASAQKVMLLK